MKKLLVATSICLMSTAAFSAMPAATEKLAKLNPNLVSRISPDGKSCMQSAPCSQAAAAPAPTTGAGASTGGVQSGEAVFNATCTACHSTGLMGSPKFGNKADWAPRIAQGVSTLYQHALGGFTGKNGTMPAKGGNAALSDADVKAGVDYMVSKAK